MNQYKDTTQTANTLETQNKPPIKRVIHALLDCLLIAGMILFLLLVVTNCQPAIAAYDEKSQVTKSHNLTYENTSQLTYETTSQVSNAQAYRQALHKHSLSIGLALGKPSQNPVVTQRKPSQNLTESQRPFNQL